MRYAFLSVCLFALGCGPSVQAFDGSWTGRVQMPLDDSPAYLFDATIVIAGNLDVARVSGVCLDGSGSIDAHAVAEELRWEGAFACPPFNSPICESIVLTYAGARVSHGDPGIAAEAFGAVRGCGVEHQFAMIFAGAPQIAQAQK